MGFDELSAEGGSEGRTWGRCGDGGGLQSRRGREVTDGPSDGTSVVWVEEELRFVLEESMSCSSLGWLADIRRSSFSLALLTCSCKLSITAFF